MGKFFAWIEQHPVLIGAVVLILAALIGFWSQKHSTENSKKDGQEMGAKVVEAAAEIFKKIKKQHPHQQQPAGQAADQQDKHIEHVVIDILSSKDAEDQAIAQSLTKKDLEAAIQGLSSLTKKGSKPRTPQAKTSGTASATRRPAYL